MALISLIVNCKIQLFKVSFDQDANCYNHKSSVSLINFVSDGPGILHQDKTITRNSIANKTDFRKRICHCLPLIWKTLIEVNVAVISSKTKYVMPAHNTENSKSKFY